MRWGEVKEAAIREAKDVAMFDLNNIPELAFDHEKMIINARDDLNEFLSGM